MGSVHLLYLLLISTIMISTTIIGQTLHWCNNNAPDRSSINHIGISIFLFLVRQSPRCRFVSIPASMEDLQYHPSTNCNLLYTNDSIGINNLTLPTTKGMIIENLKKPSMKLLNKIGAYKINNSTSNIHIILQALIKRYQKTVNQILLIIQNRVIKSDLFILAQKFLINLRHSGCQKTNYRTLYKRNLKIIKNITPERTIATKYISSIYGKIEKQIEITLYTSVDNIPPANWCHSGNKNTQTMTIIFLYINTCCENILFNTEDSDNKLFNITNINTNNNNIKVTVNNNNHWIFYPIRVTRGNTYKFNLQLHGKYIITTGTYIASHKKWFDGSFPNYRCSLNDIYVPDICEIETKQPTTSITSTALQPTSTPTIISPKTPTPSDGCEELGAEYCEQYCKKQQQVEWKMAHQSILYSSEYDTTTIAWTVYVERDHWNINNWCFPQWFGSGQFNYPETLKRFLIRFNKCCANIISKEYLVQIIDDVKKQRPKLLYTDTIYYDNGFIENEMWTITETVIETSIYNNIASDETIDTQGDEISNDLIKGEFDGVVKCIKNIQMKDEVPNTYILVRAPKSNALSVFYILISHIYSLSQCKVLFTYLLTFKINSMLNSIGNHQLYEPRMIRAIYHYNTKFYSDSTSSSDNLKHMNIKLYVYNSCQKTEYFMRVEPVCILNTDQIINIPYEPWMIKVNQIKPNQLYEPKQIRAISHYNNTFCSGLIKFNHYNPLILGIIVVCQNLH